MDFNLDDFKARIKDPEYGKMIADMSNAHGSFVWVCEQLEFEPSWSGRMIAGMKSDALEESRLCLRVSKASGDSVSRRRCREGFR